MSSRLSAHSSAFARHPQLALVIGLLLALGMAIGAPIAAQAGTPALAASCDLLSVRLDGYPASVEQPMPNTVTVSVDDAVVFNESFGEAYSRDVPLGDPTVAHSWSVTIAAQGSSYYPTFTGSSSPCAPPPDALDARAALSVVPAGCAGTAERLELGDTVYASWGISTLEIGPGNYEVTATAEPGHLFADGTATQLFSGVLAASPAATVAVAVAAAASSSRAAATTCTVAAVPNSSPPPVTAPAAVTPAAIPTLAETGPSDAAGWLVAFVLLATGGTLLELQTRWQRGEVSTPFGRRAGNYYGPHGDHPPLHRRPALARGLSRRRDLRSRRGDRLDGLGRLRLPQRSRPARHR